MDSEVCSPDKSRLCVYLSLKRSYPSVLILFEIGPRLFRTYGRDAIRVSEKYGLSATDSEAEVYFCDVPASNRGMLRLLGSENVLMLLVGEGQSLCLKSP